MDADMVVLRPAGNVRATIVVLHGFARSPSDLAGIAEVLRSMDACVVLPRLSAWWWPSCTNNTRYLDRLAERIVELPPSGSMVLVGHSAGAAAAAWIGAQMVRDGFTVAGVVMVDGVESPVRSIRRSWQRLEQVPVTAIVGPPTRCNRQGALERWLATRSRDVGPDVRVIRIPGLGHGDIEDGGRTMYVRACGDDPDAPSREVLLDEIQDAVARALDADAN